MSERLSFALVEILPADVRRPFYDRGHVTPGIVHLGIGAFHRAHQAVYVDDLLAAGARDWGITGVSLRSPQVRDQLNPQDGLYTLVERDSQGERLRLIGSVLNVLVAPEDAGAVIAAMADPAIRIISMTVTEKGYCHNPATGALQADHADIVHDLANPDQPRSAIGYLVAALRARQASGAGPVTLMSCDNLPHNGAVLGTVVRSFAALVEPSLADWIAQNVTFPATMIDRIVPATTADDFAMLEARIGVSDHGMVKAEPFTQWVIEDDFAAGRPAFESVGAQMVADVRPFELAKLRMLNGSHSTIAYMGLARGHETVDQAIADPVIASTVKALMIEAAATLPDVPGLDTTQYARDLMDRFANKALGHRLEQIAMDGSQKIPQRLVQTIAESQDAGREALAAATGVAAWMRHLKGRHVNDPLAAELIPLAHQAANDDDVTLVDSLSDVRAVFGETGQASWFRALIRKAGASL